MLAIDHAALRTRDGSRRPDGEEKENRRRGRIRLNTSGPFQSGVGPVSRAVSRSSTADRQPISRCLRVEPRGLGDRERYLSSHDTSLPASGDMLSKVFRAESYSYFGFVSPDSFS